jgi:hypothetical protein
MTESVRITPKGRRANRDAAQALPPGYIDAEHTGHEREMLEVFYKACRSEGGTTDEIQLRGLKAVFARFGRPAIKPEPGEVEELVRRLRDWQSIPLLEERERIATLLQQLSTITTEDLKND